MEIDIKTCPFCGGKARINARQVQFVGSNGNNNVKLIWSLYVVCNRCHARGKPIRTEAIAMNDVVNKRFDVGNFWSSEYANGHGKQATQTFKPYADEAIKAWNSREQGDEYAD